MKKQARSLPGSIIIFEPKTVFLLDFFGKEIKRLEAYVVDHDKGKTGKVYLSLLSDAKEVIKASHCQSVIKQKQAVIAAFKLLHDGIEDSSFREEVNEELWDLLLDYI